ncbi:retrovirus-related pol polyprotein from transposon TNT 1-94 [Tanacetum coccineum]
MVPRAVLMKSGLVSINIARQNISKIAVVVNTARQVNTAHSKTTVNAARPMSYLSKIAHSTVKRLIHKNTTFKNRVIDSGCSRQMTWNMSYLTNYEEIDGGYVAFGGNPKGGKITEKGTIKTGNLDFENVYFVRELKFNLFSVSQMCDKKNSVLFNDTEFIVLSPNFKLIDESQVLLRVPLKNNMYSVDLKNIVPKGVLTCLFTKAASDESKLWHRRLGHLNFKTINKLVKGNLVRGLPSKLFENHQTYVACQKESSTEPLFKNREMNQFCEMKGILRQFSVARTPQQNGVAERRNRTLIEAAKTRLADSKLPTTFWAEAVNTACYVQNRPLVVKPHNKTPYELFNGRIPTLNFIRPFGCPVTIRNTINHLGKFDGKTDEGSGPDWLFDIDALTRIMNYKPIVEGTQSNGFACTKASDNVGQARKETDSGKDYILLPLWTADLPFSQDPKSSHNDGSKPLCDDGNKVDKDPRKDSECKDQEKEDNVNNTNNVNTACNVNNVSSTINAAGTNEVNAVGGKTSIKLPFDPNMSALEDDSIFDFSRDDEDDGAVADMNNLDTKIQVSPNPTIRIHKDHPLDQVIRDLKSATQTRKMSKNLEEHGFIEAIHEELLQFKLEEVWTLVDLPNGKRAIGSKWVFKNKKDERGIVIRNKARLVTQGYTQEEVIDYDEVFAPVARIEAIRLFLAYASFKDFMVYQMDVKSAFLYRNIQEEVYVCQPPGFEDPDFPDIVYKTEKALYGLHQAPKAWYETLSTYLLDNGFQRGKIDKILFIKRHKGNILLVKQKKDGIFISQDKYVAKILKKFKFTKVKTVSTPMETQKPLLKDKDGEEVDVHMYRLMIGSLMYLTSSRPDIMFAVKAKKSVRLMMAELFGMELKLILLHALVDDKKIIITESSVRRDLQLADDEGVDCLPNSTIFEQLTLMGPKTTAWNEFSSIMASAIICLATNQKSNFSKFIFENDAVHKGSGPWCQKTIGDTIAQTRFESVSKHSNDSLLARGNTLRSDEDRLKLDELMALCTTLQNRVLDLEKTKTTQHNEIASLKRRVKKLEKKDRSRTHKLKRLYKVGLTARVESSDNEESLGEDASKQGRIDAIDADEEITLVSVHDVNVSAGEEVFVAEQEVADEMEVVEEVVEVINTAKLIINAAQDSAAGDIVSAASATTTTATINTIDDITLAQALEEIKSIKPKKKGVVIQELAEFDEKERLAREKAEKEKEVNIALIETWDDIQKRRKNFAAKRVKEKRNKPPTQAQQRKIICTYLKNMEGYKLKDLKLKEFDYIQEMFDRAFKRVNTFEDFRTELVEGKEKRARTELIQEITKKQKVEDDKEIAELKQLMKIILDEEEVAIDAIPLAVKSPTIFDWKIYKEGRKIDY